MNHPWIKQGGKNPQRIMKAAVIGLRRFIARDNFQRAIREVSLSNQKWRHEWYLRELFSFFDRDGNGVLTYDECVEAIELHVFGLRQAKWFAKEIMNQSISGDKLKFQDFKGAMEAYQLKNDFLIQAIFFALDTNGDEYISLNELLYVLPMSSSGKIRINFDSFLKADVDSDCHLTRDEFKGLVNELSRTEFVK